MRAIGSSRVSGGDPRRATGPEISAGLFAEVLDSGAGGALIRLEHVELQEGARLRVLEIEMVPRRLNDEMDVTRNPARMRPEASVDLVGRVEVADAGRNEVEQRSQLLGLRSLQIGERGNMSKGLDNERAYAEWTNAVLHDPAIGLKDATARKIGGTVREVARKTFHREFSLPPQQSMPARHPTRPAASRLPKAGSGTLWPASCSGVGCRVGDPVPARKRRQKAGERKRVSLLRSAPAAPDRRRLPEESP